MTPTWRIQLDWTQHSCCFAPSSEATMETRGQNHGKFVSSDPDEGCMGVGCFYPSAFSICDSLNTLHLCFLLAVPRDEVLFFFFLFSFFLDHNQRVEPKAQHPSIIFTRKQTAIGMSHVSVWRSVRLSDMNEDRRTMHSCTATCNTLAGSPRSSRA